MAYGNWDDVIRQYKEIYVHSRFAEHAMGILELIPLIRNDATLATLVPGTSHTTLTLALPPNKIQIFVYCEKVRQLYTVYLYPPEPVETALVIHAEILTVLHSLVEQLSH
jgi:hypothetical protein